MATAAVTARCTLVILLLFPRRLLAQDISDNSTTPPESSGAAYGWVPDETDQKWVAGVHKTYDGGDFQHICGGTLISADVVLSAAHCFWNDGRAVVLSDYRMTVGNFLREFQFAPNGTTYRIKDLIFHERYRGNELFYAHDIVIVRLMKNVTFTSTVEPANIDWRPVFVDDDLKGQKGTVVGWGYTEFDQPSFERTAVNLPYVDFNTCWSTVPREFRSYITPDKFCAGLRNGTTVCPGDSGGGLVFPDANLRLWFIRGIVSVGVQPNDRSKCRKSQFSAFTSISNYRSWLMEKLNQLSLDWKSPLTQTERTTDKDAIYFPSNIVAQ